MISRREFLESAALAAAGPDVDAQTVKRWSAPYRNWHYWPDYVIPAQPGIPGHADFHSTDVPTVYQLPGSRAWRMSFVGFNGKGYNSFVACSDDLVRWGDFRLAMGFGKEGEFDYGGRAIGAYLYESYGIRSPRVLKKRQGRYWTLYGCYAKQGRYEIPPGYQGAAWSEDGLTWNRAKDRPVLSVHDAGAGPWERGNIFQPWVVEHRGRFYNFYNASDKMTSGWIEQTGIAFSRDFLNWERFAKNPVVKVRPGGYDARFASDPKVFRDGDHWTMFYFGVGRGGAHILAAFSRNLLDWTADPEPLYAAGGHPLGLDQQYAHKVSLVHNPANDTFYLYYCACGPKGRGIGLLTSRPLPGSVAGRAG